MCQKWPFDLKDCPLEGGIECPGTCALFDEPQVRAQDAQEYVNKWICIGVATEPADRPAAEAAIAEMYRCGGLKPPQKIVWCGSPLASGLTRAMVLMRDSVRASVGARVWDSVRASVRDSVWASVGDSVGDSVRDSVRASVRDSVGARVRDSVGARVWDSVWDSVQDSVRARVRASVRDSVGDSVWASVGDSVRDSVRASVWDSVRARVGDSVGARVGDSVWDSVYGQHEASWLGVYDFFAMVWGLKTQTAQLSGLWRLAESAGWVLPHEKICWVSERHNIVRRDPQDRLHCPDGMALSYPDGWGIWAWHGIRVTEDIIKGRFTAKMVLAEKNSEIKRVMIERMGIQPFFEQLSPKTIHEDIDGPGNPRRLLEIAMPEVRNGALRAVQVTCPSTGRIYILGVPSTAKTCQEAVASTFGLSPNKYKPDWEV